MDRSPCGIYGFRGYFVFHSRDEPQVRFSKGSKALELFQNTFSLEAVLPHVVEFYEEIATYGDKT